MWHYCIIRRITAISVHFQLLQTEPQSSLGVRPSHAKPELHKGEQMFKHRDHVPVASTGSTVAERFATSPEGEIATLRQQ